jgi:hypothetical protein
MYIAGRDTWRIEIDEPSVLRVALYIRDVEDLPVVLDPEIPPLDPGPQIWPVWARRAPGPLEVISRRLLIDRDAAAAQWARWWRHLLDTGDVALKELRPPKFSLFWRFPELQTLIRHHYNRAVAWSDAVGDNPRLKRDHIAAGTRLSDMVAELERDIGRRSLPFDLRIVVIPVQTKHAWVLSPDRVLLTHHLIADDDSTLDWLRQRMRAMV